MSSIIRTLSNGETLTVSSEEENGVAYYKARVSSDQWNAGFEGDNEEIKPGENLESIADEIQLWLEDNINV